MGLKTAGIHHITSMVTNPQRNIDFYTGVLGLRLIKKTINFDVPEVYHLYFGNESGDPGTVITFFPWVKLLKGRIGTGQVGSTVFNIPLGSMDFWELRLKTFGIEFEITMRFFETFLSFSDPDGLQIELVERKEGEPNRWAFSDIQPKHAIKGFGGATLFSAQPSKTADVLENMLGLEFIGQDEKDLYIRFKSYGEIGNIIDIKIQPSVRGLAGAGTVHHIAWRAKDDVEHKKWHELLLQEGYNPTEILDRNYFRALYFHEEGGILFEIATDVPGFTVDETIEELGTKLVLPSWYEPRREEFEAKLPQVEVRLIKGEQ